MAERPDSSTMTALEGDLRLLGAAVAYPPVSTGFAAAIQTRLETEPQAGLPWWRRLIDGAIGGPGPTRPLRRALVLALVLLLVIAAIAAAIGLGVPGIRIVFGPVPSSPSAGGTATPSAVATTRGSPGATLGLGVPTAFDEIEAATGFAPRLPAGLGQPAASYVRERRLVMVWPVSPARPAIKGLDVGLLLTEFQGRVDPGYYEKIVHSGSTVEPVTVDGNRGYWISGGSHTLFYVDPSGNPVDDTRRMVGQVLIWADSDLTYRLETAGTKDEAIALAGSIR
jgi:hypothetical protein